MDELENHLDWDSIVKGMKSDHNEREAEKCEETLRQFCKRAQDDMSAKMEEMICHIGEKVGPENEMK